MSEWMFHSCSNSVEFYDCLHSNSVEFYNRTHSPLGVLLVSWRGKRDERGGLGASAPRTVPHVYLSHCTALGIIRFGLAMLPPPGQHKHTLGSGEVTGERPC